MNDIYIFEIEDNDYGVRDNNLMLYQNKDSLLTPMVEDFENGWPVFPSFETIIDFLNKSNVNKLISYAPEDLDTICSHPYEIGDFTDYEIEYGACFHRFYHFEFSPSDAQKIVLLENKISIKYLNKKEISELEGAVKYHQ
jgi:hypothetical protein